MNYFKLVIYQKTYKIRGFHIENLRPFRNDFELIEIEQSVYTLCIVSIYFTYS